MKEKIRRKSRLTKKTIILILLAVLLPVTALVATAIAANFDVQTNLTVVKDPRGNELYEVITNNGVVRLRFQYVHNSTATLSYTTRYLYFTTKHTDGNPTGPSFASKAIDVGFYADDRRSTIPRKTQTIGNLTYEIFEIPAETLEDIIRNLYGQDFLDNPEKLKNVALYVSQGFSLKRRKTAQDAWKYDEYVYKTPESIASKDVASWSDDTRNNFIYYFDCPLQLNVAQYDVTLVTEGEGEVSGKPVKAYWNETVKIQAYPDAGWSFVGWEVVEGNPAGYDPSAEATAFSMPSENVTMKAVFEKDVPPPPPPPDTYTLTIEEKAGGTAAIAEGASEFYYGGETVTIVATPDTGASFAGWEKYVEKVGVTLVGFKAGEKTITITMPESNVTLTASFNTPQGTYDYEDRRIRYYTTDKGYSLSQIYDRESGLNAANDEAYGYVADGYSVKGWRELGETLPTMLTEYYSKGKDTSGNEWYFIANGGNATYVHPRVYKGNAVFHEGIADITELTFPETITDDYGEDYTVTSIGGGLDMYRDERDDDSRNMPSYGYYITNGRYQNRYKDTLDNGTEEYSEDIRMYFGVIGNGSITSKGHNHTRYTNGAYEKYDFQNDYHVYNTTLKSVTIPATVTTIESYAFYNCQALETIIGGTSVTTIAANAFEGAGHKTPSISALKLDTYGDPMAKRYYYYNKSYAFGSPTDTMLGWTDSVRLSDHMVLPGNGILSPSFTSLQTIGNYAFYRRNNLRDVNLPSGVQIIGDGAFAGCSLNSITVPGKDTEIQGSYGTLGTKGNVTESSKTVIITDPNANAMSYGFTYNEYYRLKAGYNVTYLNNLTPPQDYVTQADVNIIKKNMVQAVEIYAYDRYENNSLMNGYNYRNMVYLDEEGHLWINEYNTLIPPKPLVEDITFCSLEIIPGTSSSSSDGSSCESVWVIAYAENGKVYGVSPNGTCTDFGIPAGSTGHLWGDMTLSDSKSSSSPYGGNGSMNYTTANYLYYMYNGVVYRKQVYGTSSNSYNSSSGESGSSSFFTTSFDAPVKQISLSNTTVISFYVAPSSHNEKKQEQFSGPQSSSDKKSYTYTLPKIFLMTSSGSCITGGSTRNEYSDYTSTPYGSDEDVSAGYDETMFKNGPGELGYTWVTLPTSNRFRQIVTSSRQEIGDTSYSVDTPSGNQLHPSSYDNVLAIDNSGNLIYVRDINKGSNGYLHCGTAVTVSAGKNFKSITALGDGEFLLTDASGGTWKYVEAMGSITALDSTNLPKPEIVATLAVDYEFVAIMPDPYKIFTVVGDEFLGWALNPEGTGAKHPVGAKVRITAPTTFYAQWDIKSDSIIIKYHPNTPEGCVVDGFMEDDVYPAGTSPIQLKENLYRCTCTKHRFTGWGNTQEKARVDYEDKATIGALSPGTHTFYAQWETISLDEFSYTVKIADKPRETPEKEQSYSAIYTLAYETEITLDTLKGWTRTVDYLLNIHASMSTGDSFAWKKPLPPTMTESGGKLVATAIVDASKSSWELWDVTKQTDSKRLGFYEQGVTVSKLTNRNGAVLVFYPDYVGNAGSVPVPEVDGKGYSLVGFTKGMAYTPNALANEDTRREVEENGIFLSAADLTYTPEADKEALYAYYEPKVSTLAFYNTPVVNATPETSTADWTEEVIFDGTVPSVTPPVRADGSVFAGYYDASNPDGTLPEGAICYFDMDGYYALEGAREDVQGNKTWTEDVAWMPLFAHWCEEEVSGGQLYGFEIFRVFGSPAWEEIEAESLCYTVGVREGESVWETLPLRTGVHPKYRNLGGLPQGGGFAFRVRSTGTFSGEDTILTVYPVLVSVTENGYREVDVYFEEESPQGCFLKKWEAEEQAVVLYDAEASDWDAEAAVRLWNGNLILPERLWIAEKNTDVAEYQRRYGLNFKEEFWITGERLLLRLGMRAENKEGEVLFYGMIPEEIVENIWKTEAKDSYREDNNGDRYEIQGGEVAVIYPGEYADEGYKISGIY